MGSHTAARMTSARTNAARRRFPVTGLQVAVVNSADLPHDAVGGLLRSAAANRVALRGLLASPMEGGIP
jgi:hypothetical protein